jgi:hypothetical protein
LGSILKFEISLGTKNVLITSISLAFILSIIIAYIYNSLYL